jgi:hypothetical protein
MANEGVPRLVLNAFCTTCGNIREEDESIAVAQFALDHVAATKHVVVLNGTVDVVQDSDGSILSPSHRRSRSVENHSCVEANHD